MQGHPDHLLDDFVRLRDDQRSASRNIIIRLLRYDDTRGDELEATIVFIDDTRPWKFPSAHSIGIRFEDSQPTLFSCSLWNVWRTFFFQYLNFFTLRLVRQLALITASWSAFAKIFI